MQIEEDEDMIVGTEWSTRETSSYGICGMYEGYPSYEQESMYCKTHAQVG